MSAAATPTVAHRHNQSPRVQVLRPGPEAGTKRSNWMYGDNYQSYGLFETASAIDGAPNEISMLF
ncbi:MAG: hypothetical protein MJA84_12635, partial [Firmicutes bacterium]|nr:hypothetical protein [Bacillota bacterium]